MVEGTASHENELKMQGVIEAAQDPNSSVTAKQAEESILKNAKAGGAEAFRFDPDATPEEKAAQAKEVSLASNPPPPHVCQC